MYFYLCKNYINENCSKKKKKNERIITASTIERKLDYTKSEEIKSAIIN